ncbi:MAG: putative ABC transporter ATP-binding protein YknY [Turneriella sp.]|nr:putative ABC transporter ATP-binding protein YknY [Turneriella sp.]
MPIVALDNVQKRYAMGDFEVPALRGIDLQISEGEFTVIMGPSGSGKSTLLNLLGCIDVATEGKVIVCGEETNSKSEKELAKVRRKNIGFIFQAFNLIPVLSVYENVEYALLLKGIPEGERKNAVDEIIEQVGLTAHRNHRPNQLSGGQRQRVAIARALVTRPRIVLADEPTANLDSQTGKSILHLMQEMNNRYKTTFIFATHDPDVLSFAKRVIRIHDGKIEKDGAQKKSAPKKKSARTRKSA